jgi:hypothetical protein
MVVLVSYAHNEREDIDIDIDGASWLEGNCEPGSKHEEQRCVGGLKPLHHAESSHKAVRPQGTARRRALRRAWANCPAHHGHVFAPHNLRQWDWAQRGPYEVLGGRCPFALSRSQYSASLLALLHQAIPRLGRRASAAQPPIVKPCDEAKMHVPSRPITAHLILSSTFPIMYEGQN